MGSQSGREKKLDESFQQEQQALFANRTSTYSIAKAVYNYVLKQGTKI